jgi:hypothetical protein
MDTLSTCITGFRRGDNCIRASKRKRSGWEAVKEGAVVDLAALAEEIF